jgi:SAM-dependent methyltransferase
MAHNAYSSLAREYEHVLGDLAKETWHAGILAELARLAGPGAGGVIADLGAGTGIGGRLLSEGGWGHKRIGVDLSATMLSSGAQFYDVTVMADITMLPLGGACVDFAVAGFDTLNYLSAAQFARCLTGAARCLRPGGWLIFDYSSPDLLRRKWRDCRYDQQLPDGLLRWRNRYDTAAGECVSDIERYDAAGHLAWGETHIQYALDTFPLHEAAMAAGLHTERVRDLDRPEFSPCASTHVWVLRKDAW